MKTLRHLPLFLLLLANASGFAADPALAPIFSSGMVLQRDMPIPVWGSADDGAQVTVTLGKDQASATAAAGRWQVSLPARAASAEPLSLSVAFAGGATQTIDEVLVGEVWLCAGQSNMAGVINKSPPRELAEMPLVRQYGVARGAGGNAPQWIKAEGDAINSFSIASIYFAENLHQQLGVPVGLLLCAVSGTPIEEWTPRTVLESDPETKAVIDSINDREVRARLAEFNKSVKQALKEGKDVDGDDVEMLTLSSLSSPGRLYAIHIEPTVPYAIRGVIWYQGEANAKYPFNAQRYGKYLTMLVNGLRTAYGQADLPFYAVQLPSIALGPKDKRPLCYEIVRQQQLEIVRATPHTGLAVFIDANEGLHPRHKNIAGDRLAALALREVYGKGEGPYAGPLLKAVDFSGGKAVCSFLHAEGGLELKAGVENLFEIAGEDGTWQPAQAVVTGETLTLSSEAVPAPKSVRYAFRGQMDAVSLFGASGVPASPFVAP
jgi:sialate O-acetylesterase